MGSAPWLIPVIVLSAVCGIGLLFIWWWFPRMWAKGTKQEMQIIAAERQARREMETSDGEGGVTQPQQPKFVYRPSAIATY